MEIPYYPGCSLESSAKEYDMSAKEVCKALGIELVELDDWNCCGALEVASLNPTLAAVLPARNLKIASEHSDKLVVTCNACFNNLIKTQHQISHDKELRQRINKILNYEFREIQIKHVLDILMSDAGLPKIEETVKKPLKGLKTVSYYGCLMVRPSKIMRSDDPDDPKNIDEIVSAMGGTPLEFTGKTKCCGGGLLMTYRQTAMELTKQILTEAVQRGAQCVLVTCPLCQMTLESLSGKVKSAKNIPILYFTQLMGLSFGIEPKKVGLDRNMVSPAPVLNFLKQS